MGPEGPFGQSRRLEPLFVPFLDKVSRGTDLPLSAFVGNQAPFGLDRAQQHVFFAAKRKLHDSLVL
jgi:hypothetical protein